MRRTTLSLAAVLAVALLALALTALPGPGPARAQEPGTGGSLLQLFLPALQYELPPTPTPTPSPTATLPPPLPSPAVTPTPTQSPNVEWDPRLDQRMAQLVPASVAPGQGYWKLVKGVWYDVGDLRPMGVGDHDIAFDVQGPTGVRQVGLAVKISWDPGQFNVVYTQAKPGETYAGTYPMYHIAPTYRAEVDDGAPSDAVTGLGMGTILDPTHKVHTSYGFIWRWTVVPMPPTATPTPSATPTGTATPTPGETPSETPAVEPSPTLEETVTPPPTAAVTPSPTDTPSPTPSPTQAASTTPLPTATSQPTATPSLTPSPTPLPTPLPPRVWDPRLTQLGTVLVHANVLPGQGYWRLVEGVWYDAGEGPFASQSLILVDALDQAGSRQVGTVIRISSNDGATRLADLVTELKPGEPYAANFQMYELRPAYRAQPAGGAPADLVYNLGQGSVAQPGVKSATRYGFKWQWTIAGQP